MTYDNNNYKSGFSVPVNIKIKNKSYNRDNNGHCQNAFYTYIIIFSRVKLT